MDLNTTWFLLFAVLIAGYAVLDGFDLGVGVLQLFARTEEERRAHVDAVGPVWDGNEVWLLTGGGALFAAFPPVYATVFSGFYLALMLLLLALILRAVSMEFRHQLEGSGWTRIWDLALGLGSLLPALLFGVAVGNVLRGVPIDAQGNWTGTFLGLLNPFALVVGLLGLAFFVMHGAIWLWLKTEGALEARMRRTAMRAWAVLTVLWAAATGAAVVFAPHLLVPPALSRPLLWLFVLLLVGSLVAVPLAVRAGRAFYAFVASAAVIVSMIGVAAASMFPRLVVSSTDLAYSLTAYNASSSPKTLSAMLVVALVGMPLVLAYTVVVYRVFRGKIAVPTYGAS